MEDKGTNDKHSKSDYRKVLRPASIVFNDQEAFVYPGTKRILNWKFSLLTDADFDREIEQTNSYLNFNELNSENTEESNRTDDEITFDGTSKFLRENSSTLTAQERQNLKKEIMGKRTLTAEPNNNQPSSIQNNQQIANQRGDGANIIYGWRKQCLYAIIFLLMVLISVNLALTLWILKVMEISSDGIGQLKVVDGGVQLEGQAVILDELKTSHIRSRHGLPITFESSRNITFNARDSDGLLENQIFLGNDKFEVLTRKFQIKDPHGNPLFSVDRDFVEIAAGSLRLEGEGGVTFKDSVQTNLLKSEPGKDLKLESPTRGLSIQASQDVFIQSRAGSIEVNSLDEIKLRTTSSTGSIRLDAANIILSNLKTIPPPNHHDKPRNDHLRIFQVCICGDNGKLFLAPSYSVCAGEVANICR